MTNTFTKSFYERINTHGVVKYKVRGKEYTKEELGWRLNDLDVAIMKNSFDTDLDDEYQDFLDAYRLANQ